MFHVSTSRLWKNGMHMGRHSAGADLTAALKLAPHGEDKIMAMPVVATLAADGEYRLCLSTRRSFCSWRI